MAVAESVTARGAEIHAQARAGAGLPDQSLRFARALSLCGRDGAEWGAGPWGRGVAMFVLMLTACLAADPAACAPRLLPQGSAAEAAACQQGAEAVAAAWLAAHPDLTGQGWTCAPLAR